MARKKTRHWEGAFCTSKKEPTRKTMSIKHNPEDNIGNVYLDLVKLENHVALLKRSLRNDLDDLDQKIADLYLENLEVIQETIAKSRKSAVRVMCYFSGDSCD